MSILCRDADGQMAYGANSVSTVMPESLTCKEKQDHRMGVRVGMYVTSRMKCLVHDHVR